MFKGKAVTYQLPPADPGQPWNPDAKPVPVVRAADGSYTKIWFPDGPPPYNQDTEAADEAVYADPATLEAWKVFRQEKKFADGLMPLVPPRREWCTWDF